MLFGVIIGICAGEKTREYFPGAYGAVASDSGLRKRR